MPDCSIQKNQSLKASPFWECPVHGLWDNVSKKKLCHRYSMRYGAFSYTLSLEIYGMIQFYVTISPNEEGFFSSKRPLKSSMNQCFPHFFPHSWKFQIIQVSGFSHNLGCAMETQSWIFFSKYSFWFYYSACKKATSIVLR